MGEHEGIRGGRAAKFSAVVLGALATLPLRSSHAGTKTWDNGAGDAAWFTASNWNPDALPVSSDDLTFPVSIPGSSTIGIASSAVCNSLTLNAAYTLGGAGTLNIGTSGSVTVPSSTSATLNTTMNGTHGLTKAGAGTLVLGGANSFTNLVTVSAGTLQIDSNARLGNANNGLTLNGGTLASTGTVVMGAGRTVTISAGGGTFDNSADETISGTITGSGALAKSNTGTLCLSGDSSGLTGAISVNGGVLECDGQNSLSGSAPVTIASGATLGTGQWDQSTSRVITCNGGSISVGSLTSLALISPLGAGSGNLIKTGAGTLSLLAASTFSGAITVNAGTLYMGDVSAFGTGTSTVTVNSTGNLKIGTGLTWSRSVTLNSGGTLTGDNATYAGTVTIPTNASVALSGGGDTLTLTSSAPFTGGTGATIHVSGGVVPLTHSISYPGGWVADGGEIDVTSTSCLGTGTSAVVVQNNGTLQFSGTFSRAIQLSGGFERVRAASSDALTTETLTLPSGAAAQLATTKASDVWTIGNSANDLTGSVALTEISGPGKIVLAQSSNCQTGWSLTGGTLEIGSDAALGNASGSINFGGGTLSTTATFATSRSMTNNGGGIINVAPGTTFTLNTALPGVSNLTFPSVRGGGTLVLNAASPPSQCALWLYEGTLRIANAAALGTGGSVVTWSDQSVVEIANVALSSTVNLGSPATLRGTGAAAANSVLINGSPITFAGVAATDVLTIGDFAGGTAGVTTINIAGAGTTRLSTSTTYQGDWSLNSGKLQITADNQFGGAGNHVTLNGGTLQTAAAVSSTRPLSIGAGGGTLDSNTFDSSFADVDGSGNLYKTSAGKITLNHVRVGAINITAGSLAIKLNGTSTGTSRATSLTITGQLDLSNNKLIDTTDGVGSWNGSNYDGVTGLIRSGRNSGAWNGIGIVTSMTAASATSHLTTLAIAKASDVGKVTFGGQSVSATDVLVMYTYTGDANLDGKINADDYFQIDSNYNKPASTLGWFKGDFNYDGQINGDDYFLIDNAFAAQNGNVFPSAPAVSGVTAVPEPVTPVLIGLGLATSVRRRPNRLAANAGKALTKTRIQPKPE